MVRYNDFFTESRSGLRLIYVSPIRNVITEQTMQAAVGAAQSAEVPSANDMADDDDRMDVQPAPVPVA